MTTAGTLTSSFAFVGKQIHDANIVATVVAHRETRLWTSNQADFRRFGALIEIVTPRHDHHGSLQEGGI